MIRQDTPPVTENFAINPRELEVSRLLALGLTNREIGERLFISHRTVQTHIFNICNKLGVDSRIEIIIKLIKHGQLKIDELQN